MAKAKTKVGITAFCMKCRTKREIKDPVAITHTNGKAAITGKCSVCGTKVYRMGKMSGASAAPSEASPEQEDQGQEQEASPAQTEGKRSKVKLS